MPNRKDFADPFAYFLLIFLALVFPVIIFPIARIFGQSEVFEEIAKGLIVLFVIHKLSGKKDKILAAAIAGLLIGFSECFFYLLRFAENLNKTGFYEKIFFSVPLHVFTIILILLVSLKNKWLILPGVAVSIVVHLFFNRYLIYWF